MKIGRTFALVASGFLSISLLLSPLTYAEQPEGMKQGNGMKEGNGMIGKHKEGVKEAKEMKEEGSMEREREESRLNGANRASERAQGTEGSLPLPTTATPSLDQT